MLGTKMCGIVLPKSSEKGFAKRNRISEERIKKWKNGNINNHEIAHPTKEERKPV